MFTVAGIHIPSLASSEHVIKYLGQYTHRVAITNQRILNIANGEVTFITKDYRDRSVKKPVTLDGGEFLRWFTMHILPGQFVKIRRYGIYNHTVKRNLKLQFAELEKPTIDTVIKQKQLSETRLERFERLIGIKPCICPVCKSGLMVRVKELPRIRYSLVPSQATFRTFLRNLYFLHHQLQQGELCLTACKKWVKCLLFT